MKKISLKDVKEQLSRKEMRAIVGGYGGYGGYTIYCVAVYGTGYSNFCEEKGFCSESNDLSQSWKNAWISLGWSAIKPCQTV